MPLKTYSEQFKRDAVELGINRNTLKARVARFSSNTRAGSVDQAEAAAITDAEWIRQLERDILRRAVKYFAEETIW